MMRDNVKTQKLSKREVKMSDIVAALYENAEILRKCQNKCKCQNTKQMNEVQMSKY